MTVYVNPIKKLRQPGIKIKTKFHNPFDIKRH